MFRNTILKIEIIVANPKNENEDVNEFSLFIGEKVVVFEKWQFCAFTQTNS